MVRLLSTRDPFEAKLVAARLGAEGVLCEVRGGLDGPYPIGPVHLYVPDDELEAAREVLALDALDDTEPDEPDERDHRRRRRTRVVAAVVATTVAVLLLAELARTLPS